MAPVISRERRRRIEAGKERPGARKGPLILKGRGAAEEALGVQERAAEQRIQLAIRKFKGERGGIIDRRFENALENLRKGYEGLTPKRMAKRLSPQQMKMHAKSIHEQMMVVVDTIVTIIKIGRRELEFLNKVLIPDVRYEEGLFGRDLDMRDQNRIKRRIGRRSNQRRLDPNAKMLIRTLIIHHKFLAKQKRRARRVLEGMEVAGFKLSKLEKKLDKIGAECEDVLEYWRFVIATGKLPVGALSLEIGLHWTTKRRFSRRVRRRLSRFNNREITFPFRYFNKKYMDFIGAIEYIIRETDVLNGKYGEQSLAEPPRRLRAVA